MSARQWYPDVLGPDWVASDLALPGGAVATLVRRAPDGDGVPPGGRLSGHDHTPPDESRPADRTPPGESRPADRTPPGESRPAVLYVHGFTDYFFQRHVADAFEARGYPFYAVDLRGYGRSIGRGSGAPVREDDDPNFVTDLAVYAADLDAARAAIRAEGHDRLVVVGHSLGGLITSLWANARPGTLSALVLNSPWLDLNASWFNRVVTTRIVDVVGRVAPRLKVADLGEHYGRALHASTGGEWDYDLAWKPIEGFPIRAGWLRSVRRTQRRVARGLTIDCPVLVLSSDRTGSHTRFHPELLSTDSVLNVEQIRRRAARLGPDITQVTTPGGAHDLALSAQRTRDSYLRAALDWLDERTG